MGIKYRADISCQKFKALNKLKFIGHIHFSEMPYFFIYDIVQTEKN